MRVRRGREEMSGEEKGEGRGGEELRGGIAKEGRRGERRGEEERTRGV